MYPRSTPHVAPRGEKQIGVCVLGKAVGGDVGETTAKGLNEDSQNDKEVSPMESVSN